MAAPARARAVARVLTGLAGREVRALGDPAQLAPRRRRPCDDAACSLVGLVGTALWPDHRRRTR